ncbi:MAG: glycerophosphodiester phosphodiesterase [Lachnospiraceae bacterium]|nr:glycerophosphodiester phosphodiesterase [Lachnospiraceae bacterium]
MLFWIILLIIAILALAVVYLVAPADSTAAQRAPFVNGKFAHRGLHTQDKSVPENSLTAFDRACSHGYGIELDIQLSKDGQIVVFHDDILGRVCGVEGRVDDYTYEELQQFRLCGSEEKIPLFSEVLACVNGRTPLIVELKDGPRNDELCAKALAMLREYKGEFCIESFQPYIVGWFRKNAPDIFRGQLSSYAKDLNGGKVTPATWALANMLVNVISRPQFMAYNVVCKSPLAKLCKLLGAVTVVWTVRPTNDIAKITKENDCVIFEFYEP